MRKALKSIMYFVETVKWWQLRKMAHVYEIVDSLRWLSLGYIYIRHRLAIFSTGCNIVSALVSVNLTGIAQVQQASF